LHFIDDTILFFFVVKNLINLFNYINALSLSGANGTILAFSKSRNVNSDKEAYYEKVG